MFHGPLASYDSNPHTNRAIQCHQDLVLYARISFCNGSDKSGLVRIKMELVCSYVYGIF